MWFQFFKICWAFLNGPGCGLSWYMLHRHLKEMCVLLLLSGLVYICQLFDGLLNLSQDFEIINSWRLCDAFLCERFQKKWCKSCQFTWWFLSLGSSFFFPGRYGPLWNLEPRVNTAQHTVLWKFPGDIFTLITSKDKMECHFSSHHRMLKPEGTLGHPVSPFIWQVKGWGLKSLI